MKTFITQINNITNLTSSFGRAVLNLFVPPTEAKKREDSARGLELYYLSSQFNKDFQLLVKDVKINRRITNERISSHPEQYNISIEKFNRMFRCLEHNVENWTIKRNKTTIKLEYVEFKGYVFCKVIGDGVLLSVRKIRHD